MIFSLIDKIKQYKTPIAGILFGILFTWSVGVIESNWLKSIILLGSAAVVAYLGGLFKEDV